MPSKSKIMIASLKTATKTITFDLDTEPMKIVTALWAIKTREDALAFIKEYRKPLVGGMLELVALRHEIRKRL